MYEWFSENENRNYPIKEDTPAVATNGKQLPFGILADLAITVDSNLSSQFYISSVSLSPNLVSVVVASSSGGALVATIENPVVHQVYRLEPLQSDISGFVAFGQRAIVSEREAFEFSGPAQTALSPKAMRVTENPPVLSISRFGEDKDPLKDVVRLIAGPGINISRSGSNIVISLEERFHLDFVGPCDRTIEYIACGRPPLRTINGVGPDGAGKVTIEVQ
jgi:hypothetical protein